MDWNFVVLVVMWVANNAFMYRIGYQKALREALGLAEELAQPIEINDGTYWKKMYEDLVAEMEDMYPTGLQR